MNSLIPFAGIAFATALALAAAYLVVACLIAHRFTRTRRTSQAAPNRFLAPEDVRFASRCRRERIAAWYFRAPAAAGAVVLVHGRDGAKGGELGDGQDGSTLVGALLERGFSVVMIDLRGHGGSTGSRLSFGDNERHDVLGAVDWLRARGYAEGRIGVLGASMGGSAVIAAAAQEPAIGAVVADSAFADFGDILRHNFPRQFKAPGAMFFLAGGLLIARLLTGCAIGRFNPGTHALQLRDRPVLVVHSRGDRMIPASHAERIAEAAGAELWITPSEGHVGSYAAAPEAYVERIAGFFDCGLRPALALAA